MRLLSLGLCGVPAAASVLAACAPSRPPEPPAVDAPVLAEAYYAYRTGDFSTIQKAQATMVAKLPADPVILLSCDGRGYAARRAVRIKDRLDMMASPVAWSFGQDGRFVYLEGLLFGQEAKDKESSRQGWPNDYDCQNAPDNAASRAIDDRESQVMRDDAHSAMRAWAQDAKARLGPNYEARMKATAQMLYDNHKRQNGEWGDRYAD